jgi:MFS family permease
MRRWFVLFGCFMGMAVSTPAILLLPMGLFLKSLTAEFGWSRTEFSAIISTALLFTAIVMPIAGYLVDRFGPSRLIAIGTTLGCGSYAALSVAHSYSGFFAIMFSAVTLGNLASYPAFMGLAQRWFDKRLGLALAITSTGQAAGVGAFSFVIAKTIAVHGWRAAFVTVGTAALVIGLGGLILFIRDNNGPVPEAERRDKVARADAGGMTIGEALRTRDFWLYTTAFSLVIFALVGCNFHLPALLSDHGASAVLVASVVALGSAGSLLGRLITGILLDRFSVRGVAGVFFFGQAMGILLLLDGLRWALLASFLLGLVQGAEIDLLGYVVARRFGRRAYARVFGVCFGITLMGAMVGPVAMAAIFGRTGSYDLGLMLFPFCSVLAGGLFYLARFSRSEIEESAFPGIQLLARKRLTQVLSDFLPAT